jgi:hypothetical protein
LREIRLAVVREPVPESRHAVRHLHLAMRLHNSHNFYCLVDIELVSRRIVLNPFGNQDAVQIGLEVRFLLLRMGALRSEPIVDEPLLEVR